MVIQGLVVTFEQRPPGGAGAGHVLTLGKTVPGGAGNSRASKVRVRKAPRLTDLGD